MSSKYPNLLIGIGASAGGLPTLLEIIDHLSVGYQGAIFVAVHRPAATSSPRRRGSRLHGKTWISRFPRSRE
jgi:chemotaxis response regulator CheB